LVSYSYLTPKQSATNLTAVGKLMFFSFIIKSKISPANPVVPKSLMYPFLEIEKDLSSTNL
jgi:hypothetical protein